MNLTNEQRGSVVLEALSWIGTPYHHAACVKGAGVDCAYLVKGVFEKCGLVSPFMVDYYPRDWHMHRDEERYLKYVEDRCVRVEGTPQPADIALFKFGRCVSHGAIVVEWPRMIHSFVGRGVSYIDITDGEFKNKDGTSRLHSVWSVQQER